MGGKKSTSSNAGGRGSGRKETNRRKAEINPNIITAAQNKVKKDIGFNQRKHPTEGIVNTYAAGSKKGGSQFYGEETSKATNEYLVSIGEAKRGNPYYDSKGNITGYSYMVTSKGNKMKYGNSGAMGTGEKSSIKGGIPISDEMFQSQKNFQNIAMLGMTALGVPLAGSMYLNNNRPSNSYDNYLKKFYSTMSSSGIQSSQKINQTTDNVVSNQDQVVDQTTQEKDIVTTSKFKKKKAGQGDDQLASARSLFKKTGQTITGSMV